MPPVPYSAAGPSLCGCGPSAPSRTLFSASRSPSVSSRRPYRMRRVVPLENPARANTPVIDSPRSWAMRRTRTTTSTLLKECPPNAADHNFRRDSFPGLEHPSLVEPSVHLPKPLAQLAWERSGDLLPPRETRPSEDAVSSVSVNGIPQPCGEVLDGPVRDLIQPRPPSFAAPRPPSAGPLVRRPPGERPRRAPGSQRARRQPRRSPRGSMSSQSNHLYHQTRVAIRTRLLDAEALDLAVVSVHSSMGHGVKGGLEDVVDVATTIVW